MQRWELITQQRMQHLQLLNSGEVSACSVPEVITSTALVSWARSWHSCHFSIELTAAPCVVQHQLPEQIDVFCTGKETVAGRFSLIGQHVINAQGHTVHPANFAHSSGMNWRAAQDYTSVHITVSANQVPKLCKSLLLLHSSHRRHHAGYLLSC